MTSNTKLSTHIYVGCIISIFFFISTNVKAYKNMEIIQPTYICVLKINVNITFIGIFVKRLSLSSWWNDTLSRTISKLLGDFNIISSVYKILLIALSDRMTLKGSSTIIELHSHNPQIRTLYLCNTLFWFSVFQEQKSY